MIKKRLLALSLHIDIYLTLSLLSLMLFGLYILYSASNQNSIILQQQLMHFAVGFMMFFLFACPTPILYRRWAMGIYSISLLLLVAVLLVGHTGKGAERWLNLGLFRVQPSEFMKLALPIFLSAYCHAKPLPLHIRSLLLCSVITLVPVFLIVKQPDLSTGILLIIAAGSVLLLAGISMRLLSIGAGFLIISVPLIWHFLHDYQKQRVLTFFNPERDPLGAGYHIIQSKIAIGSGGLFGKGWLNGTQSHLHFLPEHATDFIFGVCGEEFGFVGSLFLIALFMSIIFRGLYITAFAQDTFSRLLAGSITITFFMSFFINVGMVTGLLPVMGVPLPLISYGGSSIVTWMASFGILMSIQTHRTLITA